MTLGNPLKELSYRKDTHNESFWWVICYHSGYFRILTGKEGRTSRSKYRRERPFEGNVTDGKLHINCHSSIEKEYRYDSQQTQGTDSRSSFVPAAWL